MIHDRLEDALRASLSRHAADAPPGDLLAERIIHAAERPAEPAQPHRRPWRGWALPATAAALVGAVVVGVLGIESADRHATPASSHSTSSATQPVAPPQPPAPSAPATAPRTPQRTGTTSPGAGPLTHVAVVDMTFTGVNDGWALAAADCVRGPGRCTALLRTTDGRHWRGVPGASFNTVGVGVGGCAAPCVQHLRFADDSIGYAYGPDALFMTTDGGATWQRQPGGGADALETVDQNVIAVRRTCPAACLAVETAPLGRSDWTRRLSVSGKVTVGLARTGPLAVLETFTGQATVYYRSGDDGASWTSAGDPCGPAAPSAAMTTGSDGSVIALCAAGGSGETRVLTSADGGLRFAVASRLPQLLHTPLLSAADAAHVFIGDAGRLLRSPQADPSGRWNYVPGVTGRIVFLGFESATVGRVVADGGRTVWTTRDAGRSWTPQPLG